MIAYPLTWEELRSLRRTARRVREVIEECGRASLEEGEDIVTTRSYVHLAAFHEALSNVEQMTSELITVIQTGDLPGGPDATG